jgi:hypothetical protein
MFRVRPHQGMPQSYRKDSRLHAKTAGSIPFVVISLFNLPNASSRTVVLKSTQSLRPVSTRNHLGGTARSARKAGNLITICEPIF